MSDSLSPHRVCGRDVRLLRTLGFSEGDATDALRYAPMLPGANSRVESATHFLCRSPSCSPLPNSPASAATGSGRHGCIGGGSPLPAGYHTQSRTAADVLHHLSPGAHPSPAAETEAERWRPHEFLTQPPRQSPAEMPGSVEAERRRLHEVLVTSPPAELTRSLRKIILRQGVEGAVSVGMLAELLPARDWPLRWVRESEEWTAGRGRER